VTDPEHIEPARARDGGVALTTVTMAVVLLALIVPIIVGVVAADLVLLGLQVLGRQARRGTGRALVWLIGSRFTPRV
jgi:hypothetical protein